MYKPFAPDLSIDPRAKEDFEAGHNAFLPYPKWAESQLIAFRTVEEKIEFLERLAEEYRQLLFIGDAALCNCYVKSGYYASARALYWDYMETVHWLNWKIEELEKDQGQSKDMAQQRTKVNSAHLVLVYWYGMKALGLSIGHTQDKTRFAWLLHLITGKECNDINNSNFYKMLKKAPEIHKTAKNNIRDLGKARMAFENVPTFSDVLSMIDDDIRRVKNGEMYND
jgi:hypothetical protein